jgi:hypothetical protein
MEDVLCGSSLLLIKITATRRATERQDEVEMTYKYVRYRVFTRYLESSPKARSTTKTAQKIIDEEWDMPLLTFKNCKIVPFASYTFCTYTTHY